MRQCTAIRANGQRCKAQVLTEGDLCFIHNPANQDRIDEARRKGGKGKGTAARVGKSLPRELRNLANKLIDAIDEVHEGKLDHKRLTAMAAGARAVVKLYEVGELAVEVQELKASLEGSNQWRA